MTDEDFNASRLVEFLRQAPEQGLLNSAVAKSRFTAVEQTFTALNGSELRDIRMIDVDILCSRLHKIQGSSIRPEVVELYKARVQAALTDYFAWLENPGSFSSIGGESARGVKRSVISERESSLETRALEDIVLSTSERKLDLVSIPLREHVTVFIANMPLDLSAQEAMKIAAVVEALVQRPLEGTNRAR